MENTPVTNRLQEIWPDMKNIVNYWRALPKHEKKKHKTSKAFRFFLLVYLNKYQKDMTMIQYLGKDLERLYQVYLKLL